MEKRAGRNSHKNSRHSIQTDFERIKGAIGDATRHAKDHAEEMVYGSYDQILDKSADFQDGIEEYTRRQPFKSLGIALFAGLVMGFLLRK